MPDWSALGFHPVPNAAPQAPAAPRGSFNVPVPNTPPTGYSENVGRRIKELSAATSAYNLAASPVDKAAAALNLKRAQLEYDRLKDSMPSVTEAQGTWGTRVAQQLSGEKDYEEAVRKGYEPTTLRNKAADLLESAVGTKADVIRDPATIRGRVGENKFLEGYMRAQSGANVGEMKEIPRMKTEIFPSPWQGVDEELRKNLYYGRMDQINAGLRAAGKPAFSVRPYEEVFPSQRQQTQQPQQNSNSPNDAQIKYLKANPNFAGHFDEKFGKGAANQYLPRNKGR